MVALVGFYVAVTLVLAGHLGGGGHGHEFLVEVGANRVYFLGGLVTGPLCGVAGSWIGSRHPSLVTLTTGGVMAGEIVAVAVAQGHRFTLPPLYFSWGVDSWTPYIAECLLGVGLVVTTWAWRRLHRTDVSSRP